MQPVNDVPIAGSLCCLSICYIKKATLSGRRYTTLTFLKYSLQHEIFTPKILATLPSVKMRIQP